ncbi:YdeI/OmpD-associated family protein [Microbulbifer spongiae]|uniref:YdeI/OmpD-associated family protein n=1 Tax=Microbulbifer spongiae TaxID=2944933 RepID=A0ABY9EBY4_9GAMM|nr:YdeI/OmpD-associated family protein [Microbulbifer sp. MI-G]WKD49672.1 YdeI/OmpD-associated family protein [Microbulbifer sp. MI-G]
MTMISNIEEFFAKGCGRCDRFSTTDCSARKWEAGLIALRRICQSLDLEEAVKWGQPCYDFAGRNIAIIGAYQDKFVLSFFDAVLMKDPDGVLEKPGPNTQYASTIYFATDEQVGEMEETLRAYLDEAKSYAAAGIKPPKIKRDIEIPEELVEAMDVDPELAEAFQALTPGRQRSYAINLNSAKKSETRISRIAKFRDKIIAGKGAMER